MRRRRRGPNKVVLIISWIVKIILVLFFLLFLTITLVQRFSNNTISFGGYRLFNVVSESMVPRYNVGDILLVEDVNHDSIKVGDDLCYLGTEEEYNNRIITHEVINVEKNEDGEIEFTTQGIANVMPDPIVNESQAYGKVIYRTVVFSFISHLAQNKYTFFACIAFPLVILIILELKDLFVEANDRLDRKARRRIENERY